MILSHSEQDYDSDSADQHLGPPQCDCLSDGQLLWQEKLTEKYGNENNFTVNLAVKKQHM